MFRKLCRFNFASSVWKMLKKAIAELNICRENFCGLLKSAKTAKCFSRLTFVVYGTLKKFTVQYI